MRIKYLFILLLTALFGLNVQAQTDQNLSFFGNARFAYMGAGSDPGDVFDGLSSLRIRVGIRYIINENSHFTARLATTQNDQFPAARFTIKPDGGGLNPGSISFDNFYYQYSNEDLEVKVGRFQHTPSVRSNSGRSIFRFQSNNINNHWVDGFQVQKALTEEWVGEVVAEYQNRGNTSYSYRPLLNFGNNEHNVAAYIGAQNKTRDDNNFIQKGFGLFIAPDAYITPNGYSTYAAFLAQLVQDFPLDALQGGSFRVASELGQNITEFDEGLFDSGIYNISAGVHNFADKHQLMIEFTKIGFAWQTANVYAPNADEMEIRYRYFITDDFNIDFRYRIRDSRSNFVDTNYNFFARATYSF